MEVRIGIATGEVVARRAARRDGDLRLTGEAITTAARIQSLARPGEILLDDATATGRRGRLAAENAGSVVLRGQSTAVELYALTRRGRHERLAARIAPRRPARWSGGGDELAAIAAALDGRSGPARGGSSSRARPAWASRAC